MGSYITKYSFLSSLVLLFTIFFFFSECSRKKKKSPLIEAAWKQDLSGIPDSNGLAWVGRYCEKIRECASGDLKSLDADASAILEKRLRKDFCVERFKESKVYSLDSGEPQVVLNKAISCLKTATGSDCTSIKRGVADLSEDCKWMYSLQNSNE